MLRVTVDLIPFGDEGSKKTLGVMHIINDGSGDHTVGNYKVGICGDDLKTIDKSGKVKSYPRALGIWRLVELALKAARKEGTVKGAK